MSKLYHLYREQQLPISMDEAWGFFSSPKNLAKITPDDMGFEITSDFEDEEIYPGKLISYNITPIFGISMTWLTEITQAQKPYYFVDEQRSGPYAMWHHEHHFREINDGIEMRDRLYYQMPFGFLGSTVHSLIVRKRIEHIFDYRYSVLEQNYGKVEADN
ncbi:MAG TPA: SRPBCC family protein [Balneolales bacterium]|nr:SRPBCC family protein [Balneolales bacterium]